MTVVLLGQEFPTSALDEYESKLKQIPRFTYRKHFSALPNGSKSDWHWGCSIRSGQGLLAQYVRRVSQAHSNRLPGDVLSCFSDRVDASFGIHEFVREAQGLGIPPGKCIKPSCLAAIIVRLLERLELPAVITDNGLVSASLIEDKLKPGVPVLLLAPMMLGPSALDPSYIMFVNLALSLRDQSLGIVGGKRRKSFFLVGHCGDEILYFDPHTTFECVTSEAHYARLFRPTIKRIRAAELSSSMLVGFYITDRRDIEEIPKLASPWNCPISVVPDLRPPSAIAAEATEEDDWTVIHPP
jgi:cysteine protease ATG4